MIQTDASKNGIGSCLIQENKPVCTEQNYAQIEKQFLAVLFACKKFHKYIYGQRVTINTDHLPLVSIMKKEINQINSPRLQRI